jgi:hypothetical protein
VITHILFPGLGASAIGDEGSHYFGGHLFAADDVGIKCFYFLVDLGNIARVVTFPIKYYRYYTRV